MTHLCYWYGAYNDPHNAYSFIATSKLIDYDQGVKKGHNTVSKVTQKNIDAGKNISSQLEQLVRGLGEMNEDLELEPSERTGRMNDIFTEEWELSDDSEDDQQQEEPEPKASKSRKKPKEEEKKQNPIKKRKKKDIGKDEPETKLKKKVKKEEETKDGKKVKKKTKDDPAVSKKKAELVDDIGDDDISSHDDKDDEDIDEPETESDDGDDYLDHGKSKPKPEITKKIKVKEDKKPPKKRAVKAKTKIEKKPAKEKKAPTQKKLKEMEQDRFEDCEKMFLPLINSWKNAIEEKDADALNDCYVELLKSVDNFTCPFIEAYEISPLLKQSKLISKNPTFKELFKACKEVYIKKRSDTPIGFQPIKTPVTEDPTTLKDDSAMQEDGKPEAVENSNDKKSNDTTQEPKVEVASIPLKKVGSLEKVNSTMRRIGSLENVDEQEVQLQQNSTAVKVERKKKFSLSGLMRPSSNPTKAISKLNTGKATASGQLSRQQKIPEWMSESNTETPSDETRSFALEFLQQAAPFIPHIKHVNHDAIARALEVATYEWAFLKEGANWVRTYWEKVDDLVASISGKHGVGTLASLIAEGKFNSPDEIIRLSDDAILCSFEGRPLPGM